MERGLTMDGMYDFCMELEHGKWNLKNDEKQPAAQYAGALFANK